MFRFSSPLFQLFVFYGFFIFGAFLFRLSNGLESYIDPQIVYQAARDNGITFIFGFCLASILWIYTKGFIWKRFNFIAEQTSVFNRRKIVTLLYFSITILLMIGFVKGVNPLSNPLLFRQAIQSGGNAYFLLFFLFSMKLFGIYFFDAYHNSKIGLSDCFVFAFVIFFSFISGFSSLFAYVFIAGFIFLNARYGVRIVNYKTILGGIFLIVLTPVYNMYRMLKFSEMEVTSDDFLNYYDKFSDNFWLIIWDRFDYFVNFTSGSKVAREHTDFTKIADFILQPIPRYLYPDKPVNFSTTMTGWVYPENILMGVTANFGFVNEFILYFGEIGPVIGGIFFGLLLFWTYSQYRQCQKSTLQSIKYDLVVLPYFGGFAAGYYNDFGLPTLILNLIFLDLARRIGALR